MRRILITIALIITVIRVAAQNEMLRLDTCLQMAERQNPVNGLFNLSQDQYNAKTRSIKTAWYPSLSLNAQATWQNEVTTLDVDLPFLTEPLIDMSKDQYKVVLDVRQNIWDGGSTKQMMNMEQASLKTEQANIENEIFHFKQQIAELYFSILKLQKQEEVLLIKKWQLQSKIEEMNSAIENGVVLQDVADVLESEILSVEQKIIEIHYEAVAMKQMMAVYLKTDISDEAILLIPTAELSTSESTTTTDVKYLMSSKDRLAATDNMLKTTYMPKIFAFTQAGYGRPGLNMMSDDFSPFFIVGAKLVWTPFDWGKTKNDRESIQVQQKIIDSRIDQFNYQQKAMLDAQMQRIEKAGKLLEKDDEILVLKHKITLANESKLKMGTITASEYLIALDEEQAARLNYETHLIMQAEAVVKYNLLIGIMY